MLTNGWQPSWSPAGNRIAFVKQEQEGASNIWVVNVDGPSQPRQVTQEAGYKLQPSWSPNEEWIASVQRDRLGDSANASNFGSLWVIRSSGGEPLQLCDSGVANPVWSPDGGFIAYSHDRSGDGIHVDLWVVAVEQLEQDWSRPVVLFPSPGQDWVLGWVW